jgi:hypothetical protein
MTKRPVLASYYVPEREKNVGINVNKKETCNRRLNPETERGGEKGIKRRK